MKTFSKKFVTFFTLCVIGMPAFAEDTDRPDVRQQEQTDNQWQDTKRSAKEFWQDFKQDSGRTWENTKDAFRDGWIEGKVHTAITLNEHLNPFDIAVAVENDTVRLSGTVASEVDKELAEAIAIGVEGIDKVENHLTVDKAAAASRASGPEEQDRTFGRYVMDAVLTADVKTDLFASSIDNVTNINVDVRNGHVVLKGRVKTEEQKELAEKIAKNNTNVLSVSNQLQVRS